MAFRFAIRLLLQNITNRKFSLIFSLTKDLYKEEYGQQSILIDNRSCKGEKNKICWQQRS